MENLGSTTVSNTEAAEVDGCLPFTGCLLAGGDQVGLE